MVQKFNNERDLMFGGALNMKFSKGSKLALALLVVSLLVPHVHGQPYYTPLELSFIVYPDGYVAVDYEVNVDPTRSRVNVSLFGDLYEYLLLEDQDGLLLDSSPIEGGLAIDTLGVISVTISYQTTDLTGKAGQIWTFTAETPISSSVVLPGDVTIRTLSPMPLAMSDLNGNFVLTMPAGNLVVSYTLGERARAEASEDIDDAQATVTIAQTAGRTEGLDAANDLLQQAVDAYEAGDYEEASALAGAARSAAASATAPETGGFDMMFVAAAALIVVAAAAFFLMRRKPPQPVVSVVSYDLEALFADRPHLRLDDKEVIRFLAENGGESFAAEIRERFNVPRTSLWRMIRRLQREEVVEVHNIGGQSLVRIIPRYIAGGEEG